MALGLGTWRHPGEGVYPLDLYGILVMKIGGEFHFPDVYTNYG
jgi:hypothetical protein